MVPHGLKFTREHEWVRFENGSGWVGITDHAQAALGDITFVELPPAGKQVKQGEPLAVIESVKAAGDVFAPLSGTVAEVNMALDSAPELINQDPYGKGWVCRLEDCAAAGLDSLMSPQDYEAFLAGAP
jgi:glycine cleavage system H protein